VKIEGHGKALRIYIGESDSWHGRPLYQAIVKRLREEGLAGATVLRGIEGFGAHSRLHTARILRMSEDLPVLIEVIDREDRIRQLLPILDEMVTEGLVTLEDVDVIFYRANTIDQEREP
jgi:PII-like signaling protein